MPRPPRGLPQNDSDGLDAPARESSERRRHAIGRALAAAEPLEQSDRLDDLVARDAELQAVVNMPGLTDIYTNQNLRTELDEP